jgi:hypothetical protein
MGMDKVDRMGLIVEQIEMRLIDHIAKKVFPIKIFILVSFAQSEHRIASLPSLAVLHSGTPAPQSFITLGLINIIGEDNGQPMHSLREMPGRQ